MYWDIEVFGVLFYFLLVKLEVMENLLEYWYNQFVGVFYNVKMQGLVGVLYLMVIFNGIECYNEWEIMFEEIY